MSKLASKANEIFEARETLTPSEETSAAQAAVAADPENPDKYMELGLCLRRQMFFREAIDAYSVGLTYDPFHCLLYRHRGHAYVNIGQYREAAADFEMGLRLDPKNWDCWYHLGLAYHLMGAYDRALKAYESCYALSFTDTNQICTTDWECLTLMRMGRVDEMLKVASRVTEDMECPDGASAGYFYRVLVYSGRKSADEVLAEAEAGDDHAFATYAYGLAVYFECVTGEKDRARRILERIAQRDATWSGFAEHAAADRLKVWND